LAKVSADYDYAAIVPVSAAKGTQTDELLAEARKHLPNEGLMFPEDDLTDKSERFLAAEYIREKVFRLLGDELPYSTTVEIENSKSKAICAGFSPPSSSTAKATRPSSSARAVSRSSVSPAKRARTWSACSTARFISKSGSR
jgi:hypothetical protein